MPKATTIYWTQFSKTRWTGVSRSLRYILACQRSFFSQYISKFRKLLKGLYSILLENVYPCVPQSWLFTKGTIVFKLHIFPNFGNCLRYPQEIVLNSVKPVFPAVLALSKLAKSCYRPYFLALWNIFVSENSWRDPQQIEGTGVWIAGSPGWLHPDLPTDVISPSSIFATLFLNVEYRPATHCIGFSKTRWSGGVSGSPGYIQPCTLTTSSLANWCNRPHFSPLWAIFLANTLRNGPKFD